MLRSFFCFLLLYFMAQKKQCESHKVDEIQNTIESRKKRTDDLIWYVNKQNLKDRLRGQTKAIHFQKGKMSVNVIDGHMFTLNLFWFFFLVYVSIEIGWWTSIYVIIIQSSILWKWSHFHVNRNIKLINDVNGIERLWRQTSFVSNKNTALSTNPIKLDSEPNSKAIFYPIFSILYIYAILKLSIVHYTSISPTTDPSAATFCPNSL